MKTTAVHLRTAKESRVVSSESCDGAVRVVVALIVVGRGEVLAVEMVRWMGLQALPWSTYSFGMIPSVGEAVSAVGDVVLELFPVNRRCFRRM